MADLKGSPALSVAFSAMPVDAVYPRPQQRHDDELRHKCCPFTLRCSVAKRQLQRPDYEGEDVEAEEAQEH